MDKKMHFKFFSDPENFSSRTKEEEKCSICGNSSICFDTAGYSGVNTIDCICYECLKSGKLIELDIEANMTYYDGSEEALTIIYKTPAYPAMQNNNWPYIDGEFPKFERVASQEDFKDKDEFVNSFLETNQKKSEIEWLWEKLSKKPLNNYSEADDVLVYLFSLNGKKYWIWEPY